MKTQGIYFIRQIGTDKFYIGSSINIERRWVEHRSYLRRGKHGNRKLQNAWNKYGEAAFVFHILKVVEDVRKLTQWEAFHIQVMEATKHGFNLGLPCPEDHRCRLFMSPETKQKMSVSRRNRPPFSPETRRKLSSWPRMPMSSETRKKISDGKKLAKFTFSPETRRKWSILRTGKIHSEETRCKMSASQRSRQPTSEETRQLMSAAAKEREAAKRINGTAFASEETRHKMSEAQTLRWAKIRAAKALAQSDSVSL